MNTVKIGNRIFTVEKIETLKDLEDRGLNNLAREMKKVRIVSNYVLSYNGKFYTAYRYDNGVFGKVISIPTFA